MFLLAFFGFLRCSEFTAQNTKFDPTRHPRLADLIIHDPSSLVFTIKHSKTDQYGNTTPIFLFKLNNLLSPYEPLLNYIHSRRAQHAAPSDPLFVTNHGSVATRTWFHSHLRLVLSKAGYSPELFSGHSFRIGAASTASSKGVPDHVIQILGRWSSQAYHSYIRTNSPDLHNAHLSMIS